MLKEHEGRIPLEDPGQCSPPPETPLTSSGGCQSLSLATTTCSLERILGLLELLGLEIDQYMRLHIQPQDADDQVAESWMQTALEDISATLVGISSQPQHRQDS